MKCNVEITTLLNFFYISDHKKTVNARELPFTVEMVEIK